MRPEGTTGDSLTGKPELFATNLLLKRALDQRVHSITFRHEGNRVEVQLEHPEEDLEAETLSEEPETWDRVIDRLRDHTESGEFQPQFPGPDELDSIQFEMPDDDTAILRVQYQEK